MTSPSQAATVTLMPPPPPDHSPWSAEDPDSPVTFNLGDGDDDPASQIVVYHPEPLPRTGSEDSASGSASDGDWSYDLGDDDYDHDGNLIKGTRKQSKLLYKPQGNRRIAQAYDRRRKVVEMRLAGEDFPTIARSLHFSSVDGARQAFRRAMADTTDVADQYRDLTIARLESTVKVLWPMVEAGDLEAIDKYLKTAMMLAKITRMEKMVPPGYGVGEEMDVTVGAQKIPMVDDVNLFLAALPGLVALSPQPMGRTVEQMMKEELNMEKDKGAAGAGAE